MLPFVLFVALVALYPLAFFEGPAHLVGFRTPPDFSHDFLGYLKLVASEFAFVGSEDLPKLVGYAGVIYPGLHKLALIALTWWSALGWRSIRRGCKERGVIVFGVRVDKVPWERKG